MATFQYRAAKAGGGVAQGLLDATDRAHALAQLRQRGQTALQLDEARGGAAARPGGGRTGGGHRAGAKVMADLGVLLKAGFSIDRALGLAVENIEQPAVHARMEPVLAKVREGVPLSRAIAEAHRLLPPMAQAMIEAGEANGRLGEALQRLAEALERAEGLRQLVISSSIYPAALALIAVSVILLMLLFVVPQFESVFAGAPPGKLPAASLAVMRASQLLRGYGWWLAAVLVAIGFLLRRLLSTAAFRRSFDRTVLVVPQLGRIVSYSQTAQFVRTLAVLIEGGVELPSALATAQRSLTNAAIADAVAKVAVDVREGGGLSAPLAATGMFPKLAIGFFRTGEESSQLGPMLDRLADMLEADVRLRLQRFIAILTPAITVLLGGIVAGIIAAIMTAILGFNDLAVG